MKGGLLPVPEESWRRGCGWPACLEIKIPSNWPSGFYYAEFQTLKGTEHLHFIVRPRQDKTPNPILYVIGDLTYQAYNSWGGKSIYNFNSTEGQASTHISYNRPYSPRDALDGRWDSNMIPWLEREEYKVDFCSQSDLIRHPEIMGRYKVQIRNGHDEYWTRLEYERVEAWLNQGGRLASFSGNTCCTQVRLEDNLRTLVCYRKADKDPAAAKDKLEATCCFRDLGRSENKILGAGFHYAGYVGSHGHYPLWQGNGGYEVQRPDHWVFAGTGFKKGNRFGTSKSIVGYETDGCLTRLEGGFLVPTGEDGTPPDFTILATAPAATGDEGIPTNQNGLATMGLRQISSGGMVFNAATTDWCHGLYPEAPWNDAFVPIITKNVLNRMLS